MLRNILLRRSRLSYRSAKERSGGSLATSVRSLGSTWLFMIVVAGSILLAAIILIRVVALQRFEGASFFRLQASSNVLREFETRAPRGTIFDVNGTPLAWDEASFQLVVGTVDLQRGVLDDSILRAVSSVSQDVDLQELKEQFPASSSVRAVVLDDLSRRDAIKLEQLSASLAGIRVLETTTRRYVDFESGLGQVLGYTGSFTDQDDQDSYSSIDHFGRAGLELQYDEQLRGKNGREVVEVDAQGAIVRTIENQRAEKGQDITLSIDIGLQVELTTALLREVEAAESTAGSAVILDPETSEIRAVASLPLLDNQKFTVGSVDDRYVQEVLSDELSPLTLRAIESGYTSGSVIKPVVAAAALQEGIVSQNTVIEDNGFISVPSQFDPAVEFIFRGWRPEGLGPVDVRSALAWSSNIYFYTVAGGHNGVRGLGADSLVSYYDQHGLGSLSGVDLPGEFPGLLPSPEWKQEVLGEEWFLGDTYNISIGQGDLLVTPLQMAVAHAQILNDGVRNRPSITVNEGGGPSYELFKTDITSDIYRIVREGMRQVVTSGTTSPQTFTNVDVDVAGKSGTAETNTPDGRPPHAWYTAFAPYESPELVGAVIIEEGSGGSRFAAPVLASAYEAYFDTDESAEDLIQSN